MSPNWRVVKPRRRCLPYRASRMRRNSSLPPLCIPSTVLLPIRSDVPGFLTKSRLRCILLDLSWSLGSGICRSLPILSFSPITQRQVTLFRSSPLNVDFLLKPHPWFLAAEASRPRRILPFFLQRCVASLSYVQPPCVVDPFSPCRLL